MEISMTHIKSTGNSVKLIAATFWFSVLIAMFFFMPVYTIPLAIAALFHFAYLALDPIPLPVVLSFLLMISISLYVVYMNTAA